LPEHRHHHLGKNLLEWCLVTAKELGYVQIRLDTLFSMKQALSLYHSAGFYEIPAYRFNPFADAVFMEKKL